MFTDGLAAALARRGHRVTVFSEDPAPNGAPYDIAVLPARAGRLSPLTFPFAVRRTDFSAFDLIHAQGDEQFLPFGRHPPVIRTMHGTSLAEAWFNGVRTGSPKRLALHAYFYAAECLADLRADAVVAVSAHTARFYPRVDAVIPNGIDLEAWVPDGTPKSSRPSILFVGEVDTRKRGRLLLEVFTREVLPAIPDAQLWMVGPVRAEPPGSPGPPGVEWCGTVPDKDLQALMRRAWVMCLPSAYEGFGRPYAEAMAAGTAVVATSNPGAREVLQDGRAGIIADDRALGQALIRLLQHPDERADFERRGLERAQAFSWSTVAAAYERVYERVLASRGGGPG